ncbi:CapA family protein [Zobellella denitrificans]
MSRRTLSLFLCGDVMTGRGIDQILPRSCPDELHEAYMTRASGYVRLAERRRGRIPRRVGFAYVWGDALAELARVGPAVRVINLETSITTSEDWQPKGINYRMHPANLPVLGAAGIDVCALANNHVLDWGRRGLLDTLAGLERQGIRTAGAGRDLAEARAPARIELGPGEGGRLLIFALALASSGVPESWAAGVNRPGVFFLPALTAPALDELKALIRRWQRPGDRVLVSIHWGPNWGYAIPAAHRDFARALIDEAGVDLVHGHSSHHVLGLELYRERLILYGCGDFINDYEGIHGYEQYRPDLVLMFFPVLERDSGRLQSLRLVPLQLNKFRLCRARPEDAAWLAQRLNREGKRAGTAFRLQPDGSLTLDLG